MTEITENTMSKVELWIAFEKEKSKNRKLVSTLREIFEKNDGIRDGSTSSCAHIAMKALLENQRLEKASE